MKKLLPLLMVALVLLAASSTNKQAAEKQTAMPWRGVVYDVELHYGPGETFSVDSFNKELRP